MERHNTNNSEKSIEFMLVPETDSARVNFQRKEVSTELSSDFSLPDYMPEIRKLLKITPLISPISRYISGNNVEFSGRVDYELLYTAGDGSLSSAPLGTDFSFDVKLDMPSTMEWDDTTDACADISVDSLYCRVLAPRKVNVKCRLRSEIRAYGTEELSIDGISGNQNIEKLTKQVLCADFHRHISEVFEMSDEIPIAGNAETVRPVKCTASVGISEASASEGSINCRGDVVFHVLYENKESKALISDTKKVPFTQSLEASEVDSTSLCRIRGICSDTSVQVDDGKLLVGTEIILQSDTAKNIPSTITKDVFAVNSMSDTEYRTFDHSKVEKNSVLSQTVMLSAPLADFTMSSEYDMVDCTASASIDSLTTTDKNATLLSGNCKIWLLGNNGEEFSSAEVALPFTLSTDFAPDGENNSVRLNAIPTVTDCRVRVDGEMSMFDIDLSVSYCILSDCNEKIVQTVSVGDKIPCGSGRITVYYPQKNETLWDTAKKFRTPIKSLAEANDLASFDGNNPITGKRFIMICQ